MKIQKKIIFGFLSISLFIIIVGYLSINISQGVLQTEIENGSVLLAHQTLDKIDRDIYSKIEEFQSYSKDLTLLKCVKQSNQDFENLENISDYINEKDTEWTSEPSESITPFMDDLINNELSQDLREKIEFYKEKYDYKLYGEVFVTNRYGANIAQTGKTSDYNQNDEEWWSIAVKDGLYVSDVGFDDSARIYSIDICIKINDENGTFLGVMKVVLNIEEIFTILNNLYLDGLISNKTNEIDTTKSWDIELIKKDGRIIYST